jgi:dTDP-4-dehydrorhamnose 3,5-epimerase
MFEISDISVVGCYEIQPRVLQDTRGRLVKTFHKPSFAAFGLATDFTEEYYTHSRKGVIRGMHFQAPPHDHVKVVYCVHGRVFDVVVDLRIGSPTYGQSASVVLDADKGNCLYIPKGLAHGFCALSEIATLAYKVTTVYAPASDSGIAWNSLGVEWPVDRPIMSERDRVFAALADFQSPFVYGD